MSDILSWIRVEGPFLIAHRGFARDARENTPLAFEAALEAGADGVELDVRITADGVPVVHHDSSATTETGGEVSLETASWEEVSGTAFSEGGHRYRVPRLDRVLEDLTGRCLVNVEVKPVDRSRRNAAVAEVYRVAERVRPRESLLISSFDPALLEGFWRMDRALLLGYLFSDLDAFNHLDEHAVVDGLTALLPRHDLVDGKFMRRAAERGLQVHAWTADDPGEIARLVELGVTGVITNRADGGLGTLA